MNNSLARIIVAAGLLSGLCAAVAAQGAGSTAGAGSIYTCIDKQGRKLVEESNPAGGYYFRSDHFNFAKAGVPAKAMRIGRCVAG